jgi:uncharacterized delta-60 repeat protein
MAQYNPDGSLDLDFGSSGIVQTPIGGADVGNAVARQADGKLLYAGDSWNCTEVDVAIGRYLPNGALDPDFGTGGIVTTDIAGGSNGATAIAIQPDGNIVVAGYSYLGDNGDMSLFRYLTETFLGENAVYLPLLLQG